MRASNAREEGDGRLLCIIKGNLVIFIAGQAKLLKTRIRSGFKTIISNLPKTRLLLAYTRHNRGESPKEPVTLSSLSLTDYQPVESACTGKENIAYLF